MKRKTLKMIGVSAAAAFVLAGTQMFAAPKSDEKKGPQVRYISPNNDGVLDELVVNFNIDSKAKNSTTGYITAWNLRILDSKGNIVRTIGNKIKFPEEINAKSIVKQLASKKESVEIPPTVSWNGYLDDGSLAKDGTYYYQIWTLKANGKESESGKATVIVDNTPPEINLVQLTNDEKNFGEGAKAVLPVKQSGSSEERWTAKITDMNGKIVKTWMWEKASPDKIIWNGTDDNNAIVPDGIYNYEITSTDLAGNVSEKAVISNIIFSAEKPEIAIAIAGNTLDSRFFAPAPKGEVAKERKNIQFDVSIPSPKASVNSLVAWEIAVVGKSDDNVLYSVSGKEKSVDKFTFDGKGKDGKLLAEGEYRTKVTARYLNGYEPKPVYSPVFVLDNEAPNAVVTLPSNTVFNGQDLFRITQQAAAENSYTGPKNWIGKIVDAKGKVVRQYNFGSVLPSSVDWNGLDENGQFKDDSYKYVLEVTELAGNKRTLETSSFTLDTSKTELAVSVAPNAFSPNGDNVQDKVTITPVVNASSGIKSYEIAVSSNGKVVKTFKGEGKVPSAITWDGLSDNGTRCADGDYIAKIKTVANSGTEAAADSGKFILDSTAPVIKVSVPYVAFSPEETSSKKTLPVKVAESSVEVLWTAEIRDAKNKAVKTIYWHENKASDFAWDGTDDNGNKVANGTYSLAVFAKDAAGNKGDASITGIVLDARPATAYVTAEYKGISPNGDKVLDVQKFDVKTTLSEGIASWKFDVVDAAKGNSVKQFSDKDQKNLPAVINWAGDTADGTLAEGVFKGKLHIEYTKGNIVDTETAIFICTTKAPELSVRTAPAYFSPDNDGNDDDLFVQLKCKAAAGLKNWSFTIYNPIKDETKPLSPFWKTAGKNVMTER
ncbi:MAG: flagellar motor protein MotB, partial [Treponema sp.]|nr:flagellar motor protein MotB [Candidatus Treponema equi]